MLAFRFSHASDTALHVRAGGCLRALLVLIGWCVALPGHAWEWDSRRAVERLCAVSAPMHEAMSPCSEEDGDGNRTDERARARGACMRDADPMSASLQAHGYARERAELLVQTHVVRVGAEGFRIAEWDEHTGTLHIEIGDGIALDGLGVVLAFPGRDAILLDATQPMAERIATMWRLGALSLDLAFELAASVAPERTICLRTKHDDVRVEAVLVAASLRDSVTGERLIAASTPEYVLRGELAGILAPQAADRAVPHVTLTALHLMTEGPGLANGLMRLQLDLESRLSECYLRALAENSGLQGALVVAFEVGAEGVVSGAEVVIDALDCPLLSECVTRAMNALQVRRSAGAGPVEMRASMTFSRRPTELAWPER